MGWFNRKKREAGPFDGLTPEGLSDLVAAYRTFAGQALFGKEPLVVSPGSPESVQFLKDLTKLSETLDTKATRPESVSELATEVQAGVDRFGGWQRAQAQLVIDEFTGSLTGLAECCSGSLDSQDDMVDSLKGMGTRLADVRKSNDIVKIRAALQEEVTKAHRAVSQHTKSRDALRERFDAKVREMEDKIARAEQRAQTDHVTNLANRAALELHAESIMHRIRFGEGLYCMCLLDLDGLKGINEKYGHAAGDGALNHFAGCLKRSFPAPAFVGRFGGDEFVVVLPGDAASTSRRIASVVGEFGRKPLPILCDGKTVSLRISATAGTTEFRPNERLTQTLSRADQALQAAKSGGKGQSLAA